MSTPRSGLDRLALLLATLFGAGRSPIVPGTVGTLASLPLAAFLAWALPSWGFAVATIAIAVAAVLIADRAVRLLAHKDPRAVVIDETAGLLVTLLGQPLSWPTLLGGVVLFRVMDVLKPPPARRAERLPGGWGVVTDDLIAGLYANLALRVLTSGAAHFS